jgi:hypothetical protein
MKFTCCISARSPASARAGSSLTTQREHGSLRTPAGAGHLRGHFQLNINEPTIASDWDSPTSPLRLSSVLIMQSLIPPPPAILLRRRGSRHHRQWLAKGDHGASMRRAERTAAARSAGGAPSTRRARHTGPRPAPACTGHENTAIAWAGGRQPVPCGAQRVSEVL